MKLKNEGNEQWGEEKSKVLLSRKEKEKKSPHRRGLRKTEPLEAPLSMGFIQILFAI
jgi:hypothetical protein